MKDYDRIKKMIRSELAGIGDKGSISHSDVETIYKLVDIMKDISTIEAMEDGYSNDGYGDYSGDDYSMDYDRSGRMSRARRPMYSGTDDYSGARHYVRGHYSYADERTMMLDKIEDMLDDSNLSLDDKSALRKAMSTLRK